MVCKKPDYREFCSQVYKYVPACEEIDNKNISSSFILSNSYDAGLILQIFELGGLFLEKKMVKFRPRGICMYPCIRPWDDLCIEPRSIAELKIGDIAVYRRYNHLYAHRIIAKGNDSGRDYIVTRPDSIKSPDDGPTFEQDILGIVSGIKRKGRGLSTQKKEFCLIRRFFLGFYLWQYPIRQFLYKKTIDFVMYLQQCRIYRIIFRLLFIRHKEKIEFSLQAPINPKSGNKFFKKVSENELLGSLKAEPPISNWAIVLNINSKPAGRLSFALKPENCPFYGWWLYEAKLKARYRKTDLEGQFLNKAYNLLKQTGAKEVRVSVFKDEYLEQKIFKRMGFKEVSRHRDIFVRNRNNEPVERLIMKNSFA